MIGFLKRIVFRNKANGETYINYLKKKGIRIGKGTKIFEARNILIDTTRPWLITIGKNVQLTRNVTILTHGYDWSVLKGKYGEILGSSGKVTIGDNCFIGINTTILKGTTIGNNVIIGANSLVNKDIPNNVVVAGNPARVIMSIDEYYEKRKNKQFEEAKELVQEYYKVYGKIPEKHVLKEFFWLFENRKKEIFSDKSFEDMMHLVNNYEQSINKYKKTCPQFTSYEKFIEACNIDK